MTSLFKTPKTPKVKAPTPIPLPDGKQTTKARRKAVAKQEKTSGFTSTILSSGSKETLGA